MRFGTICAAMTAAFLFFAGSACAQEMDAAVMRSWMNQFADALDMLTPLNDSTQTVDPARPGEYLIEYEFGTVTATTPQTPNAEDILEIDVRTQQVTDCRGTRVGASLQDALGDITNSADGRESGCAERTGERASAGAGRMWETETYTAWNG